MLLTPTPTLPRGVIDMDHQNPPTPDADAGSLEEGLATFEPIELTVRPLILFLIGMVVSLTIVMFAIRAQFSLYVREAKSEQKIVGPAPLPVLQDAPAADPLVQPQPLQDMLDFQAKSLAELSSLGWVEPGKVARIPIDDAIKMLAAQGLPARPVKGDK